MTWYGGGPRTKNEYYNRPGYTHEAPDEWYGEQYGPCIPEVESPTVHGISWQNEFPSSGAGTPRREAEQRCDDAPE